MYNHLWNLEWGNTNEFNEYSKEYKYRSVILRDGFKVYDEIKSIWSLRPTIVDKLVKSWNTNNKNAGLEYIYYLI